MPYGYGVGFVKATSDNVIRNLKGSFSSATIGTYFEPFRNIADDTSYQVPNGKNAIIALERTISSEIRGGTVELGYANSPSGTNFVSLGRIDHYGLAGTGNERYWVLTVPSNKYIVMKVNVTNTTYGAGWDAILVIVEVV
jgi:hypothetical protein